MTSTFVHRVALVLAWGGALLTLAGIALAVSGHAIRWESIGVSAQNPMRVASEGLFALLAAAALAWDRCNRRKAVLVAALLAAFYASLAGASKPRRVGDGHEYIAMARLLSMGALPAASEGDLRWLSDAMGALPGYERVDLRDPSLLGADGRQDFRHFWLYPLAAAPVLAVVACLHQHWNLAFLFVNVALLVAFAYVALLELPVGVVLLLAAGPVLWWIDKAQIEVFNVALCGLAFLLMRRRPGPALLPLGILSAQNPAFQIVLVPAALTAFVAADKRQRHTIAAWGAGAMAVSALSPVYYLLHLGRPSPLAEAAVPYWPSITAVMTPLVDPFCGFLWYCPALLFALALSLPGNPRTWRDREVQLGVWAALALLVIFTAAGNVNHGGTPGPSRYGLWLMPFTIPLLRRLGAMTGWRQALLPVVALATMAHGMWAFHPRFAERSVEPPAGATWLMEHWPAVYDPLPEVFAERYGGLDGHATLPLASAACGKVLLAGDGRGLLPWPIPCVPAVAPAECTRVGALCYASRKNAGGYTFSPAPRQPTFGYQLARDLAWRSTQDLAWMPAQPHWDRLVRVPPSGPGSLVRGGRGLARVRAFQDGAELLAFVDVLPGGSPMLEVRREPGTDVWVMSRASRRGRLHKGAPDATKIQLPRNGREAVVLVRPKD